METASTDPPGSDADGGPKGYCLRFDRVIFLRESVNQGLIMLARTTSGKRPTPRWSIPEAVYKNEEKESQMRSLAKERGLNVYGGRGSHFWFWWTKEEHSGIRYEAMRDITMNLLKAINGASTPF